MSPEENVVRLAEAYLEKAALRVEVENFAAQIANKPHHPHAEDDGA